MRYGSRTTAVAFAAAMWFCLMATGRAEAGLSVTMNFNGINLAVPSLELNDGSADEFSFGGNNSYAVYQTNGTYVGLSSAPSTTMGRLSIQLGITNNAPGSGTDGAKLFNVTHDVRSNGGGAGASSLVIAAKESNFTAPTGSVTLGSAFSFEAIQGGGSGTFLSELLDSGDSVIESVSGTGTKSVTGLTGPYQLRNVTTITLVNANSKYKTSGETTVTPAAIEIAAVPEPSTLALGAVALGLIALRRLPRRAFGKRHAC